MATPGFRFQDDSWLSSGTGCGVANAVLPQSSFNAARAAREILLLGDFNFRGMLKWDFEECKLDGVSCQHLPCHRRGRGAVPVAGGRPRS